jgi:hypothetical protein
MLLDNDIYTALNVTAVTTMLDKYKTTNAALFSDRLIPQDFKGRKSINFYQIGTVSGLLEYQEALYVANCRAGTHADSRAIAAKVVDEINRSMKDQRGLYISTLATIPPADDTDVYNTPVEITIKKRG